MPIMLIAPRINTPLLAFLEAKFASDPDVIVVRDRRYGPRRQHQGAPNDERRGSERRLRTTGITAYLVETSKGRPGG